MTDLGSGAKGAASGALAGSAFGPWGTAIGGGIGFLGGWLGGGGDDDPNAGVPKGQANYDYANAYIKNQLGQNLGGRQLDFSNAQQARGQMGVLAGQLQHVSNGSQAGAGELAVNRQMGQATAAQQSLARMAHGANAALAARTAARNTSDLGVAGAGQAAMAQMTDQANARGQLAGVLGTMRQGDYQQTGQQQQMMGLNDQTQMGYLSQMLGMDQNQFQEMMQRKAAERAAQQQADSRMGSYLQGTGQVLAQYSASHNDNGQGQPLGKGQSVYPGGR